MRRTWFSELQLKVLAVLNYQMEMRATINAFMDTRSVISTLEKETKAKYNYSQIYGIMRRLANQGLLSTRVGVRYSTPGGRAPWEFRINKVGERKLAKMMKEINALGGF